MCSFCDIDAQLEYLANRDDMHTSLEQLQSEQLDSHQRRIETLRRHHNGSVQTIEALQDRVYRLETTLDVLCHSLGIKLVEPLNASSDRSLVGTTGCINDSVLSRGGQVVETPRTDTQSGGEEETSTS